MATRTDYVQAPALCRSSTGVWGDATSQTRRKIRHSIEKKRSSGQETPAQRAPVSDDMGSGKILPRQKKKKPVCTPARNLAPTEATVAGSRRSLAPASPRLSLRNNLNCAVYFPVLHTYVHVGLTTTVTHAVYMYLHLCVHSMTRFVYKRRKSGRHFFEVRSVMLHGFLQERCLVIFTVAGVKVKTSK